MLRDNISKAHEKKSCIRKGKSLRSFLKRFSKSDQKTQMICHFYICLLHWITRRISRETFVGINPQCHEMRFSHRFVMLFLPSVRRYWLSLGLRVLTITQSFVEANVVKFLYHFIVKILDKNNEKKSSNQINVYEIRSSGNVSRLFQ